MGRLKSTIRELSAEARLHFYARSLSKRTRAVRHIALYGALAMIMAIVFGTLSVHPF
jgi:hypothetical protein